MGGAEYRKPERKKMQTPGVLWLRVATMAVVRVRLPYLVTAKRLLNVPERPVLGSHPREVPEIEIVVARACVCMCVCMSTCMCMCSSVCIRLHVHVHMHVHVHVHVRVHVHVHVHAAKEPAAPSSKLLGTRRHPCECASMGTSTRTRTRTSTSAGTGTGIGTGTGTCTCTCTCTCTYTDRCTCTCIRTCDETTPRAIESEACDTLAVRAELYLVGNRESHIIVHVTVVAPCAVVVIEDLDTMHVHAQGYRLVPVNFDITCAARH